MPSDVEIRPATVKDIAEVVERGRQFYDMTEFAGIVEYDPDSLESNLLSLVDSEQGAIVVAESGDRLIGFAAMVIMPLLFNSRHRLAQELFWWVHPDRRHGIGTTMLNALLAEVKARGADTAVMVALDAVDGERVGKLYQRKGFKPLERHWLKVL